MTNYKLVKRALQKVGFKPVHHFGEKDVLLYKQYSNPSGKNNVFIRWNINYTYVSKFEENPGWIYPASYEGSHDRVITCQSFNKSSRRSSFSGILILYTESNEIFTVPEEIMTDEEKKLFNILSCEAHGGMGCSKEMFDEYMSYIR